MDGSAGAPRGVARLASLLTSRLRRDSILRAASLALAGAAGVVILLEVAARIVVFPALRILEAGALAAALLAGIALHLRSRPPSGAWRALADRMTPQAGVFSAAAEGVTATRLTPLVDSRAEAAATTLLSGARSREPVPLPARVAALAVLVAAVAASLPGRRTCSDDLRLRVLQARILEDVRALKDEAARGRNAPDAELLAKAAEALERRRFTTESARRLAAELREAARDRASRNRELADALAKQELFGELARALRHEEGAALDRALEDLAARVRGLDARSKEALAAASLLLELAASETDPDLEKAFADAGAALSGGSGSDGSERVRDLGPPLRKLLRSSQAMRDVVVTLESAAEPRGPGDLVAIPARPARGARPSDLSGGPPSGSLPSPADLRSYARPGTADELVLKRYFAIP